jgi:UrcA family protein
MIKFALGAAMAASVSLLAVAPAAAEDFTVQVPYSDLKLDTASGAEALAQRVASVCERPDIRNLKAVAAWQDCKDTARDSAMEQLNSKGIVFDSAAFIGA